LEISIQAIDISIDIIKQTIIAIIFVNETLITPNKIVNIIAIVIIVIDEQHINSIINTNNIKLILVKFFFIILNVFFLTKYTLNKEKLH
jgi:hypothetical protein